jgi:hypothetical protein
MANNLPGETSILYLDQNVVRYVTNSQEDNPGVKLGMIIDKGVEIGALICPFSHEHFWESAGIGDEGKRRTQLTWLARASRGACFMNREELLAAQLLSLVRTKIITAEDFLCEVDVAQNEIVMQQMRAMREQRKKVDREYFSGYNLRRARGRQLKNIPREVERVREMDVFFMGIVECIVRHLHGHGEIEDRPFGAQVLAILINEHAVQRVELELILERLISTRGHCAPLIKTQSKLFESWMLEQKELAHNDMMDLHRISTALPYADILVLDGEQCRHLESVGLPAEFGAKVFSIKDASLLPLCDEIVSRIHRRIEHLASLRS